MKKKTSSLFITIIASAILSLNMIYAQTKPVIFERFSTHDGLSQNRIYDIVQDNLGFIWIGTEDGLNRYDGYNFKIYKNIPGDTTSMITNVANRLFITRNGDLWLANGLGGLCKFNSEDETFINYQNDHSDQNTLSSNNVYYISEDLNGNLWICTGDKGVDYLDISTGKFYHMVNMLPQGYAIDDNTYFFAYQDSRKQLWVGNQDELRVYKISYSEKGVPHLKPIKLNQSIFSPSTIEEDKEGNVWIGTYTNGLFRYDIKSLLVNRYPFNNTRFNIRNMLITDIETDGKNTLWLSALYSENGQTPKFSNSYGVMKIDLDNNEIQQFKNDPENEKSISSNYIQSLYMDRTKVLWAGSFISGINKYDQAGVKFNVFKPSLHVKSTLNVDAVRGFFIDANKVLWLTVQSGGLLAYNTLTGNYRHYHHKDGDKSSLSSNNTSCLYNDGKNLWIGSTGLNLFEPRTQTFKSFYLDPSQPLADVNHINYNIIEIDTYPGYLWFGTSGGGLVRFNKKDHSFKNYTYDPENDKSFNSRDNYVRTVWYSKTRPDELWTGTTHGINIFNLKTETFRYYEHDPEDSTSLSFQNVMHFYEDKNGYIWISTYGGGLNRFDPKTEKFIHFTESNSSLPNNGVYGLLADEKGYFWISTNNGISKFNPNTFEFRNYTVDDGLQSEEFNGGSYYKTDDGEMFFGGINGFNSFYPSEVKDNPIKPEILITNLKLFNESVKIGKNSPLKKQISNIKDITLAYWQNDISFEYVGLHYANPPKNKYAFKLENYEDEWRYVGNTRIATYTNLDPGEYTFRVKGSNNDGLWNEAGTSLKLTILYPWWRTNWAYFGYFLLTALLVLAIDRFQHARVKALEKRKAEMAILEAENQRKTKELEEARQLQLSMLPKNLPQLPHLDIAVYMQTATEVGGDYYDFHVGLDGTLTVVIGDATGHGMRAGTMVTAAKSLFNSYAPNPDILFSFKEITRCIKQMNMGKMSMCLSMLKIQGDKLLISSAGMPPSFIFRRDTRVVEEHLFKAMPLGTMEKFPYQIKDTTLQQGDTILLMSDGLPELENSRGEMYGYKRVRNRFEDVAEKEPAEIISHLKNEGAGWVNHADPDDDVTFVVIKVK